MKLACQPITLDLRTTFRIAHGASDQRFNVISSLAAEEWIGYGEAAAVSYHGETQAGILKYLTELKNTTADSEKTNDPFLIEDFLNQLPQGSQAAKASLDIAQHDWIGKKLGLPVYRLLGLNPQNIPETSFTIAIDKPELMAERARAMAADMSRLNGSCAGNNGLRMPIDAPQRSSACACNCPTVEGAPPFAPRQSPRTVDGALGG